jgi:L-arabinokinase
MVGDPMGGYLANLDPDDYKRMFRSIVPQALRGAEFLEKFGGTIDTATAVDPDATYAVQHATDHHILEARRVRNFAQYLEAAHAAPGPREKGGALDRAGHLMYASHQSYSMDAMLGAPECDLLVQMVRARERKGLYGARITGGGSGGTVAVLAETTQPADAAIAEILGEYEKQTGRVPEVFAGSSDGAWHAGTCCGWL